MKNKLTSLILVAAIALLANVAGMGLMANAVAEANDAKPITLCFEGPNLDEF